RNFSKTPPSSKASPASVKIGKFGLVKGITFNLVTKSSLKALACSTKFWINESDIGRWVEGLLNDIITAMGFEQIFIGNQLTVSLLGRAKRSDPYVLHSLGLPVGVIEVKSPS